MSLDIGPALRDGIGQLISRTGAILLVAYVGIYAVYQAAFNGLILAAYRRLGLPTEGAMLPMAIDAPIGVLGALVLALLVVMTYWSVVAVRTFVAGERDRIPREFLTRRPAFAVGNLIAGGIVLAFLIYAPFVVPAAIVYLLSDNLGLMLLSGAVAGLVAVAVAVYLMVSLLFMTVFVACEDDNFVAALRNSWSLTEGNRLAVFLLLLVVMALGFVVGLGFGVAQTAVVLAGGGELLLLALNAVLIAPMSLFNLAVVAAAYNQLREVDDGPATGRSTPDAPSSPM